MAYEINTPDVPKEYQGLLDSNPYQNLDYKKSFWQKLFQHLGFRTGYDKRMEDLQLQANEWNANVANMAFENEFNSPAAASGRMRSAGQNPDLLGTGDVAESASMPEDMNPPASTESDLTSVTGFANTLMSALTMSMGLAKDFKSLGIMQNEIESGNVEKSASMVDFALNAILQNTAENDVVEDSENGDYLATGWQRQARDRAYDAYSSGFGKRDRKRFGAALDAAMKGLPTSVEQYKLMTERVKSRSDFWQSFESGAYSEFDSVISVFYQEIGSLIPDIMRLQVSNQESGLEVESGELEAKNRYYSEFNSSDENGVGGPELAAQSDIASSTANKAMSGEKEQNALINKKIRSTYSRIVNRLEKLANSKERGHVAASISLLALQIMSMISVSQSSGFTPQGNFFTKSIGFQ